MNCDNECIKENWYGILKSKEHNGKIKCIIYLFYSVEKICLCCVQMRYFPDISILNLSITSNFVD